ncbi:MAG: hypothetical protein JWP85_709 [Rhodoglobus sp.]|nr:hypothetical protein [Rhodoglobus sp.]
MQIVVSLAFLALTIFVLVDIITSDESRIRNLPKIAWVIVVILLPLIGSILWFVAGRSYDQPVETLSFGDPRRREQPEPLAVDDDDVDAAVEKEIAFHENEARIRRLEAEIRARREAKGEA